MYLWDDWENLMMPEYLKVLPFIKSVYKEHFSRQLCLEICKILRSYHWNWADLAYPLKEFIVKPYAYRGDLNLHEKRYNFSLSKSREVVENTFRKLKGRFQCLSKRLDTSV